MGVDSIIHTSQCAHPHFPHFLVCPSKSLFVILHYVETNSFDHDADAHPRGGGQSGFVLMALMADPPVIGPTVSSNTKSLLISIKRKEKSLEKLLATYRRNSKGASDLRRQIEESELKLPI